MTCPETLVTSHLLSVSTDFPIQNISFMWNHVICGFLFLSSFIMLLRFLCTETCILIPFHDWIIFHRMDAPQFVYLLPATKFWSWDLNPGSLVSESVFLTLCIQNIYLLVVQWLRLHAPNAGSLSLSSGQGTRSYMPQLRVLMLQLNILHAATKTHPAQSNK